MGRPAGAGDPFRGGVTIIDGLGVRFPPWQHPLLLRKFSNPQTDSCSLARPLSKLVSMRDELLLKAQAGDAEAIAQIIRIHQGLIRGYVARLAPDAVTA